MAEERKKENKENTQSKPTGAMEKKPVIASCWQLEHALNLDIENEHSIRDQLEEVYDNGRGIPCHACDRFGKDRQSDPALACITCNLYDKEAAEQVKGIKKKECWQMGILTTSKPYSCAIQWELPENHQELKFPKETHAHEETSPSRRTRRSLVGIQASAAGSSQSMEERWPKLEKLRRELEDQEVEAAEVPAPKKKTQAPSKTKRVKAPESDATSSSRQNGQTETSGNGTAAQDKGESKKKKASGDGKIAMEKGPKKKAEDPKKKAKASPKSKKRKVPPPNSAKDAADTRVAPQKSKDHKKAAAPTSRKKKDHERPAAAKVSDDGDNDDDSTPAVAKDSSESSAKRQKTEDSKKAPSPAAAGEEAAVAARPIPPGVIPPTPLMAAIMDQSMMMLASARAPNAPNSGVTPAGAMAAAARVSSAGAPLPFQVGAAPSRLFGLAQQSATLQSQHSAMQSQLIAQLQLERNRMLKRCALLEAELRASQAQNKALMDFNYKLEASMNMLQTQQQATQSRMQQLEQFSDSLSSVEQGVRRILDESFKPGTHKQTKIKAIWNAIENAFGENGRKDCQDFISKHHDDITKKREGKEPTKPTKPKKEPTKDTDSPKDNKEAAPKKATAQKVSNGARKIKGDNAVATK